MRMWGVDPGVMCKRHLLGEHVEMHMFVGTILKGVLLEGTRYVSGGLVEVHNIKCRHDELVVEFCRRGYPSGLDHRSPIDYRGPWVVAGRIDISANLKELSNRCEG